MRRHYCLFWRDAIHSINTCWRDDVLYLFSQKYNNFVILIDEKNLTDQYKIQLATNMYLINHIKIVVLQTHSNLFINFQSGLYNTKNICTALIGLTNFRTRTHFYQSFTEAAITKSLHSSTYEILSYQGNTACSNCVLSIFYVWISKWMLSM